jgi:hypothetical protein
MLGNHGSMVMKHLASRAMIRDVVFTRHSELCLSAIPETSAASTGLWKTFEAA